MAPAIKLLTCIQGVPHSNSGHDSILMEVFMVFLSLSMLVLGEYLEKGHNYIFTIL